MRPVRIITAVVFAAAVTVTGGAVQRIQELRTGNAC
jgi:hypothetical protein